MINWLKNRINQGINKLVELGRSVIDGFTAVWNVFATLMHVLRNEFANMANWVRQYLNMAYWFARWTWALLRHLFVIAIPNAVRQALNSAVQWAANAVASARNYLQGLINSLSRWASTELSKVGNLINRVRDWLWGYVKSVVNWVTNYGGRLVDIVLHPDKLATWVVPALWGPLWRYLQAQATPIGRWVLARSVRAALAGAGTIETILTKLL